MASATLRALLLVPLLGLALTGCSEPREVFLSGGLLLLAVAFCLWRGQEYGTGVGPGIGAGLLPLLLPVATRVIGHPCTGAGCSVLPIACAFGGLAGGVLLGLVAPRPGPGRRTSFVVACDVAALTGAVGCLLYGFIGLLVMSAGLAAGAVPLLAARWI